jgi:hypothetical protein
MSELNLNSLSLDQGRSQKFSPNAVRRAEKMRERLGDSYWRGSPSTKPIRKGPYDQLNEMDSSDEHSASDHSDEGDNIKVDIRS